MIVSLALRFALAVSLAVPIAGCQAERRTIPVMSIRQYEALPPSQQPTVFRDPDPQLGYPYNIHETDGLSRNPDDCVRWGCIDNTNR